MASSSEVIAQLNKQYSSGTITTGSKILQTPRIPTGIFTFDLATGGGFPMGRISIPFGAESSTKSLHTYRAMAWVQKHCLTCRAKKSKCKCSNPKHKRAALVDLETVFDPLWGQQIGLDVEDLIVVRADFAEQAVDIVEALAYADDIGIIVVDSVAALTTHNEVESEAGKQIVGGASLLAGKLVRKIGVAMTVQEKKGNFVTFLLINQIRFKIGVMFGNPETTPGGQALRFASSLSIRLYGKDKIDKSVDEVRPAFKEVSASITKAKCPVHSKTFEYDVVVLPHGDNRPGDSPSWNYVLNYLKGYGVVAKVKSGWECLGQTYKVLDEIKSRYLNEEDFMLALQEIVIQRELAGQQTSSVDAPTTEADMLPPGASIDKETGEIIYGEVGDE